jgi:hypothetical protein
MLNLKQFLNRRLTGRQTAVAVLIVVVLAGLGYLAYDSITTAILDLRVQAAMPKVRAAIREQRRELLSAIDAYKAHFGVYPPDHVVSRQPLVVDAVKNPLLYELVGVIYNPTNKMFQLGRLKAAEANYVKEFFQCDGFKNCGEKPEQIKRFLTAVDLPARQLHDDPDVFAIGFFIRDERISPEVEWEFDVSSWRYVSSSPTNNPGKFDLWIEVKTKKRTVAIGNWNAVD